MNAGSATVDLGSAAAIRTIDLQLNAGSLGLTLPNLSMTGTIRGERGLGADVLRRVPGFACTRASRSSPVMTTPATA